MSIKEEDIDEEEGLIGDALDLMTKAVKVHSKDIDLNEDATLSNLDSQLSKYAKYVMEQVAIVGVLRSFFKESENVVRYSNVLSEWGKKIVYDKPEEKHFEKSKRILMNKVHSVLLLSRSVKGRPLRAFLTYGKPTEGSEEDKNKGVLARLLGRKSKSEEEIDNE